MSGNEIASSGLWSSLDFPSPARTSSAAVNPSLSKPSMKPKFLDFYKSVYGSRTKTYPSYHIPDPVENDSAAEYALLKRNVQADDSHNKFSLHLIVVQSPLIKKVLKGRFEGFDGITITIELERLEFEAPFRPFFHHWNKFCEARNVEEDADTRMHPDLLWEALEKELRSALAMRKDLLANGVITYDYLWTILDQPGTLIFTNSKGQEGVFMLQHGYVS
jgi:hypothetical protein